MPRRHHSPRPPATPNHPRRHDETARHAARHRESLGRCAWWRSTRTTTGSSRADPADRAGAGARRPRGLRADRRGPRERAPLRRRPGPQPRDPAPRRRRARRSAPSALRSPSTTTGTWSRRSSGCVPDRRGRGSGTRLLEELVTPDARARAARPSGSASATSDARMPALLAEHGFALASRDARRHQVLADVDPADDRPPRARRRRARPRLRARAGRPALRRRPPGRADPRDGRHQRRPDGRRSPSRTRSSTWTGCATPSGPARSAANARAASSPGTGRPARWPGTPTSPSGRGHPARPCSTTPPSPVIIAGTGSGSRSRSR